MGDLSKQKFQTGNHVRVYASGDGARTLIGDGKASTSPLGTLTGSGLSQSTGAREIHVVGDAEPAEIVDGAHTYTIRLDMLRFRETVTGAVDLVNAGPVDIEFLDRFNKRVVAVAEGCQLADASLNIPANAPVARNLTFRALRVRAA